MSVQATFLTPKLYSYILDTSINEHLVSQELRDEILKDTNSNMMIGLDGGQFLAFIIKCTQSRRCLELGMYMGYSTLWMALALKENLSKSHNDKVELITCDIDESKLKIAKKYWAKAEVDHIILFKKGKALEIISQLLEDRNNLNSFDFIFVDADKGNYLNYYEKAFPLLRTNGIIAFDNTLWGGQIVDNNITDKSTQAIRTLNKALSDDQRIHQKIDFVFLPIGDGLSLAFKK